MDGYKKLEKYSPPSSTSMLTGFLLSKIWAWLSWSWKGLFTGEMTRFDDIMILRASNRLSKSWVFSAKFDNCKRTQFVSEIENSVNIYLG